MHRLFHINELVYLIFQYRERRNSSLLALALTCKAFSVIAIGMLWKEVPAEHVVGLLHILQNQSETSHFARSPESVRAAENNSPSLAAEGTSAWESFADRVPVHTFGEPAGSQLLAEPHSEPLKQPEFSRRDGMRTTWPNGLPRRANHYLKHVRYLSALRGEDSHALLANGLPCPSDMFPRLQGVRLVISTTQSVLEGANFMISSLDRVWLFLDDESESLSPESPEEPSLSSLLFLLSRIGSSGMNLHALTVQAYRESGWPSEGEFINEVAALLPAFPRLRHLRANELPRNDAVWQQMASHPMLEDLDAGWILDTSPLVPTFPRLRSMSLPIRVPRDIQAFLHLLESVSTADMQRLQLYYQVDAELPDMINVMTGISATISRKWPNIKRVTIDGRVDSDVWRNRGARPRDMPWSVFGPLHACNKLRELNLNWSYHSPVNDADLESLANAWPCLEDLTIAAPPKSSNDRDLPQPQATCSGLIALALQCRRLRSLSLPLSFEPPSASALAQLKTSKHSPLIKLTVRRAPVCDPARTAQFIKDLFPRLDSFMFDDDRTITDFLMKLPGAVGVLAKAEAIKLPPEQRVQCLLEVQRLIGAPDVEQASFWADRDDHDTEHWGHERWFW